MSFLSGPECSTASNPLSQFTKHVQEDKSLQRDRLMGLPPGAQFESMRTQRPMGQQDQVCAMSPSAPSPPTRLGLRLTRRYPFS